MSRPLFAMFCTVVLVSAVGCGGKPATVAGVVTLDGTPIPQGMVAFSPVSSGMKASAIIQDDGSYEIRTNRDKGLELGDYEVTVVSREVIQKNPDLPPMPGKYIAPKKYGRAKTSGLRFTIESGHNEINLELTSN